jgi:hypothetical protein
MQKAFRIKKLSRLGTSHGNDIKILPTLHVVNNSEIWGGV